MIPQHALLEGIWCVPGNPNKADVIFARGFDRPSPRQTWNASPVAFGSLPADRGCIPRTTFTGFAVFVDFPQSRYPIIPVLAPKLK